MILSHQHRFGFVHIHKTAGESVTEALYPYLGPDDVVLDDWRLSAAKRAEMSLELGLSKHSSAREIHGFVGEETWRSYFTFSFVRHPVDRARSLYRFLAMTLERRRRWTLRNFRQSLPHNRQSDPLQWPGMRAYRETASFSEFLRHPEFREDPGAYAQSDMLLDSEGRLLVDFVGRFEHLDRDFAQVVARIGLKEDVTLPRVNVSANKQGNPGPSDLVVTEEDEAWLSEIYARDFQVFGFDRSNKPA